MRSLDFRKMGKYMCIACDMEFNCRGSMKRHKKKCGSGRIGKSVNAGERDVATGMEVEEGRQVEQKEDRSDYTWLERGWEVLLEELDGGGASDERERVEMQEEGMGENFNENSVKDGRMNEKVENGNEKVHESEVVEPYFKEKSTLSNTRPILVVPMKRPDGWLENMEWMKRLEMLEVEMREIKEEIDENVRLMRETGKRSVNEAKKGVCVEQ